MVKFFRYVLLFIGLLSGTVFLYLPSSGATDNDKPLIYGIYVGSLGDFWDTVNQGAVAAAQERGYNLIYRGAGETDLKAQRDIFDIALKSGAKGIFIAPNSAERIEDVEKATKMGVPVVYIDRTMGEHPGVASFIGTNNYAAGALAGSELIRKLGSKKPVRVVVFRMDKDIVPTTEREKGFIETVKKAGYDVIDDIYITSEIGEGRERIQKFLSNPASPDFDAVFTPNEKTTTAALLTFKMLQKTYLHIGFDGGNVIEEAIRNGDIYGTVLQQPYDMGYYGVTALDDTLKGKEVAPFIESSTIFVSKETIDTSKKTAQ